MKKLIGLLAILALSGCKGPGTHEKERIEIIRKAEMFCKCFGGVALLNITQYSELEDTGSVKCNDGFSHHDYVQHLEIAPTCKDEAK